jgi:hypothetical protein
MFCQNWNLNQILHPRELMRKQSWMYFWGQVKLLSGTAGVHNPIKKAIVLGPTYELKNHAQP